MKLDEKIEKAELMDVDSKIAFYIKKRDKLFKKLNEINIRIDELYAKIDDLDKSEEKKITKRNT